MMGHVGIVSKFFIVHPKLFAVLQGKIFAMLQRTQTEIFEMHKVWYGEAVELAHCIETILSLPRTASIQMNQSNNTSGYYRCVMIIPILDHLCNQIHTRFSQRNVALLDAFYALPTTVVSDRNWMYKFSRFLAMYADDLPEARFLSTELKSWET